MPDADEAQWIEWYESLERPLYNIAYRWLWSAAESQDVVQDAFLRCWRIRDRIDPDGFKPLIYRTLLRLLSNRARSRKLWRMVPLPDSGTESATAESEDVLESVAVREALTEIGEPLKQVLLLSEIGGLSYKEIANVMNIAEGTVGSRRNRALAALRERLKARGIDWHEA